MDTNILVLRAIQEERLLCERQRIESLLRADLVRWIFCRARIPPKFPIGLNITLIVFFESFLSGTPCMLCVLFFLETFPEATRRSLSRRFLFLFLGRPGDSAAVPYGGQAPSHPSSKDAASHTLTIQCCIFWCTHHCRHGLRFQTANPAELCNFVQKVQNTRTNIAAKRFWTNQNVTAYPG